jgi:hypothetical protein
MGWAATPALDPGDRPRYAAERCYAAWLGGPWLGGLWLCRVRVRSELVAVVVPSGFRRSAQPHRWTAIWWWNPHKGTRLCSAVGPPRARGSASGVLAARGGGRDRDIRMVAGDGGRCGAAAVPGRGG